MHRFARSGVWRCTRPVTVTYVVVKVGFILDAINYYPHSTKVSGAM